MQNAKISKWGNSQGIRIPKAILSEIGITNLDDAEVSMDVEQGKLVIMKTKSESKIMSRFANFDYEKYLQDENRVADLGEPKGRELW
ncbi:AbrB/MazE/SpoVT family DNA-binding domain-containing protein [Furfurilactobacillus rossiae]|uniref:SpoVT-AbrB domain-containing protein n=1 Tax=Furfurilactobacillus rossiae DSM 15814 TaxID=1114972 RepID=A0A0R1RAE7_9LACO|nr:AbrB/MazE/SpoVT family DNA-binding domain-containing protein [Furfurilactobacillus rossiae]KRL53927.1 hypothetical protein FD35_GL000756 [Furfurilactobacillus rossiae DSM 15814]MCF6164566.1 AbrB/MazE/SpoVT family DNA-binding domain-containing protein [Furfurilactobacillus rossiae]QFR66657.1 AbrB/MazE/SpoVT family DNA-binding domain-containing protein [Furfurilactobacillus rossiae]QLE62132.1 hypothetical protein LROSRS0_2087 [Furfurilactobacillus rossiae]QLE64849.1 hypothetical protein LROSL